MEKVRGSILNRPIRTSKAYQRQNQETTEIEYKKQLNRLQHLRNRKSKADQLILNTVNNTTTSEG